MTRWTWDPLKARSNLSRHKVSFTLAERIFGDPASESRRDVHRGEERWQSIGKPASSSAVFLLFVHTEPVPQPDGEDEGRIISARRATPNERRAYEEGKF